jgi:general secretion pathway protein G
MKTQQSPRSSLRAARSQGFTLMEILLVLALLGIVISIVMPKVFTSFGSGQTKAAKIQIRQIAGNLEMYRVDCGSYPEAIDALISAPSGGRPCRDYNPQGYNGGSKKPPMDPWGTPFAYESPSPTAFKLSSAGPDKQPGTADDISSDQD